MHQISCFSTSTSILQATHSEAACSRDATCRKPLTNYKFPARTHTSEATPRKGAATHQFLYPSSQFPSDQTSKRTTGHERRQRIRRSTETSARKSLRKKKSLLAPSLNLNHQNSAAPRAAPTKSPRNLNLPKIKTPRNRATEGDSG